MPLALRAQSLLALLLFLCCGVHEVAAVTVMLRLALTDAPLTMGVDMHKAMLMLWDGAVCGEKDTNQARLFSGTITLIIDCDADVEDVREIAEVIVTNRENNNELAVDSASAKLISDLDWTSLWSPETQVYQEISTNSPMAAKQGLAPVGRSFTVPVQGSIPLHWYYGLEYLNCYSEREFEATSLSPQTPTEQLKLKSGYSLTVCADACWYDTKTSVRRQYIAMRVEKSGKASCYCLANVDVLEPLSGMGTCDADCDLDVRDKCGGPNGFITWKIDGYLPARLPQPAPPTPSPPTPAPRPPVSTTDIPETKVPQTPIPQTNVPATFVPSTPAPQSSAPPPTFLPPTTLPETQPPSTLPPATAASGTSMPSTTPAPPRPTFSPKIQPVTRPTLLPTTMIPVTPEPSTAAPPLPTQTPRTPAPPPPATSRPQTPAPPRQTGQPVEVTETPVVATAVPTGMPESSAPTLPPPTPRPVVEPPLVMVPFENLTDPAKEVSTAVQLSGALGSIGAALTMSPTSISAIGKLSLVTNMHCVPPPATERDKPEQLLWQFHPFQAGIGSHKSRYFLGAIVCNSLCIALLAALCWLFTKLQLWRHAFGALVLPVFFLYPGTSFAAVKLAFFWGGGVPVIANILGIVMLGVCTCIPLYLWQRVLGRRCFRGTVVPDRQAQNSRLYAFFFGNHMWVSLSSSSKFVSKHRASFGQYRYGMHRFLLFEMATIMILALVSALQPERASSFVCHFRNMSLVVWLVIYFLVTLIGRPFLSMFENIVAVANALLMACAVCMSAIHYTFHSQDPEVARDHSELEISVSLYAGSAYLAATKSVFDVLIYFVAGRSRRKLAAQMFADDPVMFDTDSESPRSYNDEGPSEDDIKPTGMHPLRPGQESDVSEEGGVTFFASTPPPEERSPPSKLLPEPSVGLSTCDTSMYGPGARELEIPIAFPRATSGNASEQTLETTLLVKQSHGSTVDPLEPQQDPLAGLGAGGGDASYTTPTLGQLEPSSSPGIDKTAQRRQPALQTLTSPMYCTRQRSVTPSPAPGFAARSAAGRSGTPALSAAPSATGLLGPSPRRRIHSGQRGEGEDVVNAAATTSGTAVTSVPSVCLKTPITRGLLRDSLCLPEATSAIGAPAAAVPLTSPGVGSTSTPVITSIVGALAAVLPSGTSGPTRPHIKPLQPVASVGSELSTALPVRPHTPLHMGAFGRIATSVYAITPYDAPLRAGGGKSAGPGVAGAGGAAGSAHVGMGTAVGTPAITRPLRTGSIFGSSHGTSTEDGDGSGSGGGPSVHSAGARGGSTPLASPGTETGAIFPNGNGNGGGGAPAAANPLQTHSTQLSLGKTLSGIPAARASTVGVTTLAARIPKQSPHRKRSHLDSLIPKQRTARAGTLKLPGKVGNGGALHEL